MFDRRLYTNVDGALLSAVFLLCAIGLVMIYSTTYDPTTGTVGPQLSRQLWALALGIVALGVCLAIDYRVLTDNAMLIYVGLIALLTYTLFFGVGRAQRWIDLGPFTLQASEFARMVIALVLGTLYAEARRGGGRTSDWVIGALIVALPFTLIAREPDLGTAIALVPVCLGIMIFAGLRLKFLAGVAVIAVLLTPVAWIYALEDYQRTRIASFLEPEQDPRGAGYQQIQARITVGSGGLTGKGFLQGTQSQYNFLPVAHNDFIFSVLAEEQGFLGVFVHPGAVSVRHHALARRGAGGEGSRRHLPRRGDHGRVRVPGDIQRHDVGRARPGEGIDVTADELRRVLDHRDTSGVRAHPERQDAPLYSLMIRIGAPSAMRA